MLKTANDEKTGFFKNTNENSLSIEKEKKRKKYEARIREFDKENCRKVISVLQNFLLFLVVQYVIDMFFLSISFVKAETLRLLQAITTCKLTLKNFTAPAREP